MPPAADPYRAATDRAPAQRFVYSPTSSKLVALFMTMLVVIATVFAVSGSRTVEGTCRSEPGGIGCDVVVSTILTADRSHAFLEGATGATLDTTRGSKGSTRSRILLTSASGREQVTPSFSGDLLAQAKAVAAIAALARGSNAGEVPFSFGSRLRGLPGSLVVFGIALLALAVGWERVTLELDPHDRTLTIERVRWPRRRSSAMLDVDRAERVVIETRRGRGESHRLAIVTSDLTRVPLSTVYSTSLAATREAQRQVTAFLGLRPR